MGKNDNHIEQGAEDPSRTLDAVKPMYEIGSTIGCYKLLSVLGEGGFGMVYLAEQQHPIKRLVALKVIKPGMDTKQVIARFETERQALAMLDHPHIARVFDAGATESGRPYFAMEYVKGIPITEYCDKYKLGTEERLRLFIPLCQAIQHAHHKGIIHRDIKPSNALVILHDEKPIPKIIDFGVAKALHQRLTEKTLFTEKGQFIGTPEYMSPEQAELTGLDVDTRTDIYSLGVLLYELLTGCTPFDTQDLRSKGYAQMQRIICEQDAVKPSTKLTTLGGKLDDIARHRSATADQLRKSVRGDLDWIVMKTLEKDRTRRYETANGLAMDIERHLNNEPVTARPPSKLYRFGKLVRRNKVVLDAAAVVMAVLCAVGLLALLFFHHQARIRWAREVVIPEAERTIALRQSADAHSIMAYRLAESAEKYVSSDPKLADLLSRCAVRIDVTTDPPGARVFWKAAAEPGRQWQDVGLTPIKGIRVPAGYLLWRMEKDGYDTLLAVTCTYDITVRLAKAPVPSNIFRVLDKKGSLPPGMVRVASVKTALGQVDDFLIDKYEVTNQQYREFIRTGGYEDRKYWTHVFTKEGKTLNWEEAMAEFVDQTGKPGPSTWRDEDFPPGQESYPVSGVSWYEAAAYAEFVGKSLPTGYHWGIARGEYTPLIYYRGTFLSYISRKSNFRGKGPDAVGSNDDATAFGAYDLGGNVREWCWNETSGARVVRGGAWNDATYLFSDWSQSPAFDRSLRNGFRCVLYFDREKIPAQVFEPYLRQTVDLYKEVPVPDSVFEVYRSQFSYDKTELNTEVESRDERSPDWVQERVSFDASYGNERTTVYLFLPKNVRPPYQTIVYFPGAGSSATESSQNLSDYGEFKANLSFLLSNGRAVVYPIYKGTFERRLGASYAVDSYQYVEACIQRVKDFRRTVDYLETRPDIDSKKLAYMGFSWGGRMAPIILAVEDRLRAAIVLVGGLETGRRPEVNNSSYIRRVKIPVLILSGRYDMAFPYETSSKPMFDLLGTPEKDRDQKVYETDHFVPPNELMKESLTWLDRYLGPVK